MMSRNKATSCRLFLALAGEAGVRRCTKPHLNARPQPLKAKLLDQVRNPFFHQSHAPHRSPEATGTWQSDQLVRGRKSQHAGREAEKLWNDLKRRHSQAWNHNSEEDAATNSSQGAYT
jgi:hypothetical protein